MLKVNLSLKIMGEINKIEDYFDNFIILGYIRNFYDK